MRSMARNYRFLLELHRSYRYTSIKCLHSLENGKVLTTRSELCTSILRKNDWFGSNDSARGIVRTVSFLHTSCQSHHKKMKTVRPPIVIKQKSKVDVIPIWRGMTVIELAKAMDRSLDDVFEIFLYVRGGDLYSTPLTKINNLDFMTEVVKKIGKRVRTVSNPNEDKKVTTKQVDVKKRPPADPKKLLPRPPVVTILGHVDHGKTTLLDQLRNSAVVDSEFGGITQHIGAFQFSVSGGQVITVLDTPGHAAFSSMRSRGANCTDIAVLVVAADDGVMQQTVESIQHARNAGVPIVVAINKIDKVDADVEFTKRSLLNAGVQLEDCGGDIQGVAISAKNGTNIPNLVEAVLLQAEMLNLRADPKGAVEATVIEAKTENIKGKVATCLIQRGTLKPGSHIVAGVAWARVRAMYNEHGKEIKAAPPATPVQIAGWKELPNAGDEVLEVPTQKKAKEVIGYRTSMKEKAKLEADLVAISQKAQEHEIKYKAEVEMRRNLGFRFKMRRRTAREKEAPPDDTEPKVSMILKCDVDGSLEALLEVLDTYQSNFVKLMLISSGVGGVTPTDVTMAHAFKGSIYTFNVHTDRSTKDMAHSLGVEIIDTNIIYRLVEELKKEVTSQLPPIPKEVVVGEATVQEEYLINEGKKKVAVAGCKCVKGTLKRKDSFRLLRGEAEQQTLIHDGPLSSMRHLKSEADSINKDKDCGLKFQDASIRFQKGDSIVCYRVDMVPRECDWNPPGF